MLGIIGGSGLGELGNLEGAQRQTVRTPYGEPSGPLTFGRLRGREVVFLARHGDGHTIPPHKVNYRANIWALRDRGVANIVSIASVGGIRADLVPGTLVLPDQIIDYTHGRSATYFDQTDRSVTHIDFTQPYCDALRGRIAAAAAAVGELVIEGATYAATQGPRLETAAEINRLERDGADLVGMTAMPEAALARELELCYAMIAVVVNAAAGRDGSSNGVSLDAINAVARLAMARVCRVLDELAGGNDC